MRKTVAVEWLTSGWFSVRLEYDPWLTEAIKVRIPSLQRAWNSDLKRWEFAASVYMDVDAILYAVMDEQLPPTPAIAKAAARVRVTGPPCVVCGAEMSVARTRDTCGGMMPCPVPEVIAW